MIASYEWKIKLAFLKICYQPIVVVNIVEEGSDVDDVAWLTKEKQRNMSKVLDLNRNQLMNFYVILTHSQQIENLTNLRYCVNDIAVLLININEEGKEKSTTIELLSEKNNWQVWLIAK